MPAISGIGTDLLRIDRIEQALARRGDRFARKILGPEEFAKFEARRARDAGRGIRFLATRFAAKEAFSKAIGLGMRMPMWWTRMQTLNAPGGRPVVVLSEPLKSWYEARFGAAHVSITDESDMAAAYVVVETLLQHPIQAAADPASPVHQRRPPGARASAQGGHMIGPVIVDVAGFELTAAEAERLRHPLVGVILFARNFQSRAQLTALTQAIHAARSEPLLISVDHEGGRVQRFREDGFTILPAMRRLGQLWEADPLPAMRLATDVGLVLASELRACGVDFSFAPVLDLDFGESRVIRDRAFHRDPRVAAMLARALIQGLALAGMSSCGKHFPGHGFVAADSHHEIPVDERDLDTVLGDDALPYAWLGDRVLGAVMPAHVIYPKVDARPAGFSKKWIKDILRRRLGYGGVVFSDDLTMAGAAVAGDIEARATAALQAGCDQVLVCNRPDLADELLARLAWQADDASVARLRGLRPRSPAPDWRALRADARYLKARRAVLELAA